MSLKAKIEAVIYASEEPVTLSQLAGVLGQEAQAELDRAAEAQQALTLEPEAQASEPQGLSLNETEAELEAAAEVDPSLGPDAVPAIVPAQRGLNPKRRETRRIAWRRPSWSRQSLRLPQRGRGFGGGCARGEGTGREASGVLPHGVG